MALTAQVCATRVSARYAENAGVAFGMVAMWLGSFDEPAFSRPRLGEEQDFE